MSDFQKQHNPDISASVRQDRWNAACDEIARLKAERDDLTVDLKLAFEALATEAARHKKARALLDEGVKLVEMLAWPNTARLYEREASDWCERARNQRNE